MHPILSQIAIRIDGIQAPELRTKDKCEKAAGYEAKAYLSGLLRKAKRIDARNIKWGKYAGRVVGDLYADDINVGPLMLKMGLAIPYDGGKKPEYDWCKFY